MPKPNFEELRDFDRNAHGADDRNCAGIAAVICVVSALIVVGLITTIFLAPSLFVGSPAGSVEALVAGVV